MKLKCVIIDDEPIARKILREFAEDVDFLEVLGEAENPVLALPLIKNEPPDVIFLDVNMPKLNGIDFVKGLHTDASFIITTAYAEHAVEAYGLDVLDYLVKPIAFERFFKACNKALKLRGLRQFAQTRPSGTTDHFFVKCNNQIEKVFYDDLIYAEAMLNYVMLHTASKKMMVYVTMKALEEQLPADTFIRVHKSFIVNIRKIQSIDGNVLNVGGARISVSQSLREKVVQEITKGRMIRR
jgi:DNA-binding LytR/AlgR family response regulator